ncbi:iron complex outermembrane recepter protein [Sphingomonas gellani]|uniref:Iron complex outermembrane recepter protein n=1 Tax=Sphingomonas gellani TaxID=1166340 RepID=A0A1H8HH42_9SPHN|nr:TonB-dependent receptor [Sphingomonas gellani]SEN55359.1 iron complex outermembrane recepter protein [Sphingomonas gellani]
MTKFQLLKSALLFGIAGAAMLPGSAMAQSATPGADHAEAQDVATDAAQTGEGQSGDLGEVVVTAERRSENLQRVPVSVAVIGGGDLRNFQSAGEDILALSGRVPGLYAETTTGRIFPRFYIRGLGNIDFYLGASQPVSIIQDDVVLEHVVLKSNPVFDVNQVEVLRGPQGSLFGRNTTAGIIKFDTNRPTQTLQGRASASYGELNTSTFDAGIGGPIVADKIAFRLSALVQHREDWVDNTFAGVSQDGTLTPLDKAMGGFDDRNVRLQVLLTPTDRFSVNVSAHARDYDGTSTLFHRAALKKGSNDVSAEPRDRVAYDEGQNNRQAYNTYGGSVNASYDFGPATLTSISAYETTSGFSRGDTDGGAAANFPVNGVANGFGQSRGNVRDLSQVTQEVRIASPSDGRFTWQFGGFYFQQNDTTDFYQRAFFLNTAARNPNNFVRLHDLNTSWAGFGQASFKVTPDFTITAGARETKDTKRTRLLKTADTAAGRVTYNGRRYVRLSDTTPSWDVSALYQVDPSNSVYARVARGFRGPTIQGRSAVFNSDFTTANSETITSYEVGSKGTYLDNRLRLNASLFTYTVDDIQLNGNDADGNGVLFNADKARAWGVELDAQYRPIPNLTLTAGASALKSKIEDSRAEAQVCALNGSVVCTVLDPVRRVNTAFGPVFLANINGNPLPNAPKWTLDATARYDQPLKDGSSLFLAVDGNVQGYTNFVLYKTREFYADGNFELGLKVGYAAPGGDWEIAAFARNLTNEKNLKGVIENYMAAVFNDPRVIGISLSGKIR